MRARQPHRRPVTILSTRLMRPNFTIFDTSPIRMFLPRRVQSTYPKEAAPCGDSVPMCRRRLPPRRSRWPLEGRRTTAHRRHAPPALGRPRRRPRFTESRSPPSASCCCSSWPCPASSCCTGLDHAAAEGRSEGALFAVHLAVFSVYNALITYTLPTGFEAGADFPVLFVVAMALPFILYDRGLPEHYGDRFTVVAVDGEADTPAATGPRRRRVSWSCRSTVAAHRRPTR